MWRLLHVRAFCERARTSKASNRTDKPAQFRFRGRFARPRVQGVNDDARTTRATLAALLVLAGLLSGMPMARADGQIVDPALTERMRELLGSRFGASTAGAAAPRVTVDVGQLDPRLRLAPCRRVEPQLPPPAPGHAIGRLRVALRCVEGERPWQVWLPVTVHVLAPALVPARPLQAGSVLAAADLVLAEVDWAAGTQPPFADPAALLGRSLARSLQAGEAVHEADLRRRQWFAAGDTVQVLARGAGFSVSGQAQALGAGLEGQMVRLRTESGRLLSGRPVGEGRVEVQL